MSMYWFKVMHGITEDSKLWLAAQRAQVSRAEMLCTFLALLEHASAQEGRGSAQDIDFEIMAFRLDISREKLDAIYRELNTIGIIQAGRFAKWEKHQPMDKTAAERQRRHREKGKALEETGKTDVTVCHGDITSRHVLDTESDSDEEPEAEPDHERSGEKGFFDASTTHERARFQLQRLPDKWKQWALKNSPHDEIRIDIEFEVFANYWIAEASSKAWKSDWFKAWQRWIKFNHGKGFIEQPGLRSIGDRLRQPQYQSLEVA